jgi:hypothetical protein
MVTMSKLSTRDALVMHIRPCDFSVLFSMRNGKVREGDLANALLVQGEKQNSAPLQQGKKLSLDIIEP